MEYIEYLLIKNVYHCTPNELDEQPNELVELHFAFMNTENKKALIDKKRQEKKHH